MTPTEEYQKQEDIADTAVAWIHIFLIVHLGAFDFASRVSFHDFCYNLVD